VLRELEGLSHKEIAGVVDVPMGTVMSTLFRGRERFRHTATDLVRRQAQPRAPRRSAPNARNGNRMPCRFERLRGGRKSG
jgi:hypothetical protein